MKKLSFGFIAAAGVEPGPPASQASALSINPWPLGPLNEIYICALHSNLLYENGNDVVPTFSCDERTEHANSLDHAIALHLLKATEDGSPLVRKELVVALQVKTSNQS